MVELRGISAKLAQFLVLLGERENIPLRVAPVDEYNFIFFIPYRELKEFLFGLLSTKYPGMIIENDRNKIIFYTVADKKEIIKQDLEKTRAEVLQKWGFTFALDFPSDNELLIIVKAEGLALKMVEVILKRLKEKNQDIIRLFKFKKGELEVPNFGWSLVVGVEYTYRRVEELEEMVKRL